MPSGRIDAAFQARVEGRYGMAWLTPKRKRVAGMAAVGFISMAAFAAGAAPRIHCTEPELDFGERLETESVVHTFTVENTGDAPLEIVRVQTSCGCTAARLETPRIAPGASASLAVTMDLAGRQGLQEKHVVVQSNDPVRPALRLTLRGSVIALVEIEPRYVIFESITDDAIHEQSITVRAPRGPAFTILSATCDPPRFGVEVATRADSQAHTITVRTMPDMPYGYHNGVLNIRTDHPARPELSVPIRCHVVGPLLVAPAQIVLMPSSPRARVGQTLTVRPGRVREFEVRRVELPDPSATAEITAMPDGSVRIAIPPMPNIQASSDGPAQIRIVTDAPGMEQIHVPVLVRGAAPGYRPGRGTPPPAAAQ